MRRQVILPEIYSNGNNNEVALQIEGRYYSPSIEVGELVIDYAEGGERLFIRNSNGALVPFMCSKSVMDAIAAASGNVVSFIVNEAPETFDTLKEISDWIQGHSGESISLIEDMSSMSGHISTLYEVITEDEYVAAQSLNDLNRRIVAIDQQIENIDSRINNINGDIISINSAITNIYDKIEEDGADSEENFNEINIKIDGLSGATASAISKINRAIVEDEYVAAQAFNDLNSRIKSISSAVSESIGDIFIDESNGDITIVDNRGNYHTSKIGYYLSIKTSSGDCTSVGDGYVGEDGFLYTFNGSGFDKTVKMKGEVGPQGPQGTQGVQGPKGADGFVGQDGAQGPQGVQGAQGAQGVQGVQGTQGNGIASISYTRNESPELWSGRTGGEVVILETNSEVPRAVRIYDGERGPQGIAPQLRVTEDGNVDSSYDNGTTWTTIGTARFEEGAVNNYYSTSFKPNKEQCTSVGDVTIDGDDGHIYEFNGTELVDTGISVKGPQGYQGAAGTDVSSVGIVDVSGGKRITIGLSNGISSSFTLTNGVDGEDGVGVSRVETTKNGNATTYVTYLTNGAHSAFTIYDGTDGVTPKIEVRDDGNVYVSYDNGASWTNAGAAHYEEGATNTYNTYSLNVKSSAAACTQDGDAYIDGNGVLQIRIDGAFTPSVSLRGPRGIGVTNVTTARTGSAVTLTTIMSDGTASAVTLSDGVGIASVTGTSIDGSHAKQTLTITKTNGEASTFNYYNGTDGKNGRSIAGISGTVITGNDISVNIAYDDETPTSTFIIPHGLSAYEVWLQSNPGGTREQFFNSITGDQGPQGPQGHQGPQGVGGRDGASGGKGDQGYQGPQGPRGADGTNGTNGAPGAKGDQGPQGPKGADGRDGTNGTNGTPGSKGDQGYQGPQGSQGAQGLKGEPGTSAGRGDQGYQGPQGPKGGDGTNGTNGAPGSKGDQGPQGPQGPKGSDGANGTNGTPGSKGDQGYQGPQGPKGSDGTNGTNGTPGSKGDQGYQGPQGPKGGDGKDGTNGTNGSPGSKGDQGYQGPQGPKGSDGTNGTNGTNGSAGSDGADGANVWYYNGTLASSGNRVADIIGTGTTNQKYLAMKSGEPVIDMNGTVASISSFNSSTGFSVSILENEALRGPQGEEGPQGSFDQSSFNSFSANVINYIHTYVAGHGGSSVSLSTGASRSYVVGSTAETGTFTNGVTNSGVYFEGSDLFATSDERLKDFIGDVEVDFERLASIPKKYFRWKDDKNDAKIHIGTSAQKVKEVYPTLVTIGDDDYLGVSYDKFGIVALAAIDKLHKENEELKARIKDLEDKIK